jgi:hypothetical protein
VSYDIYLNGPKETCPTCGHQPIDPTLPDPTYNLTEIFDLALTGEPFPNPEIGEGAVVLFRRPTDRPRGLRLLDGRKARDTIEDLRKAVARINDPKEEMRFRPLEPSNRWGDLKGARWVMAELLNAAEKYPEHVWEIH